MKKHILYTLLLFIFIAGCKKYEDGPLLSLRTAKARVTGKWEFEYFEVNGSDSTAFLKGVFTEPPYYAFEPEGGNGEKEAFGVLCSGHWGFAEHHRYLLVNIHCSYAIGPYGAPEIEWRILRLTNKELWLKTDYNLKQYVVHLKKVRDL